MRVLIVRHGIAMDWAEFAKINSDDSQRPLTDEGQNKTKKSAKGLVKLVDTDPELILSSPYTRAQQTAEIIKPHFPETPLKIIDGITPWDEPDPLFKQLRKLKQNFVMVVGHNPHLSEFVMLSLAGPNQGFLRIKKAGAVLLEFIGEIGPQQADLLWVLKPKQLRQLAE